MVPTTQAPSGDFGELRILEPHPRPTEAETVGLGSSHLCFRKASRWLWSKLKSESHCISQNHLPGDHSSPSLLSLFWGHVESLELYSGCHKLIKTIQISTSEFTKLCDAHCLRGPWLPGVGAWALTCTSWERSSVLLDTQLSNLCKPQLPYLEDNKCVSPWIARRSKSETHVKHSVNASYYYLIKTWRSGVHYLHFIGEKTPA